MWRKIPGLECGLDVAWHDILPMDRLESCSSHQVWPDVWENARSRELQTYDLATAQWHIRYKRIEN